MPIESEHESELDAVIAHLLFQWGRALQDGGTMPIVLIGVDWADKRLAVHCDRRMTTEQLIEMLSRLIELLRAGRIEKRYHGGAADETVQ